MSNYHITQEQAVESAMGEPVGEFNEASSEESFGSVSWLLCNREPLKTGDKLYAPKERQ